MSELQVNDASLFGKDDAESIQKILDTAKDGDTVRIPRINLRTGKAEWAIAKAIEIPSGVTVILDNCRMVQARGCYDNMFRNKVGAKGFKLIGEGFVTLSGGESNYLLEKTENRLGLPSIVKNAMIYFDHTEDFEVQNLHFDFARWASVYMVAAANGKFKNIDFQMIPHVEFLRGIIMECGCNNISIENLTGRCGHDNVCIRAEENYEVTKENEIHDIFLRNIKSDPGAPGAMIRVNSYGGHKVYNINIDCSMDDSKFYNKNRPLANIAVSNCVNTAKVQPKVGDIKDIHAKWLYSRAHHAIDINGALEDCTFENLLTFGDNIFALAARRSVEVKNTLFKRIYYGKGSEPNNAASFISRQAKGSVAVKLENMSGDYKLEKVVLEDEEEK